MGLTPQEFIAAKKREYQRKLREEQKNTKLQDSLEKIKPDAPDIDKQSEAIDIDREEIDIERDRIEEAPQIETVARNTYVHPPQNPTVMRRRNEPQPQHQPPPPPTPPSTTEQWISAVKSVESGQTEDGYKKLLRSGMSPTFYLE